jgi:hypothetical protein
VSHPLADGRSLSLPFGASGEATGVDGIFPRTGPGPI